MSSALHTHPRSYQGISPGWGDMYQAGLSGQWVVVDEVVPGPATLSALANPDGLMCEGQVQYDADGVAVTIPRPGQGAVTGPCTRGELGPKRECGFEYRGAFDCAPGARVALAAVPAPGLLSPQLRICESSAVLGGGTACTWRNAVATASGTSIAFTCPELRDAAGVGGYSLYVGDVLGSAPGAPSPAVARAR